MGFMPIGGSFRGRDDAGSEHSNEEYKRGYNDALAEVIRQNSTPPKRYHLTEQQGKAVQEVLNRYLGELASQRESLQIIHEETWEVQKDIDYIGGLAKLFD